MSTLHIGPGEAARPGELAVVPSRAGPAQLAEAHGDETTKLPECRERPDGQAEEAG